MSNQSDTREQMLEDLRNRFQKNVARCRSLLRIVDDSETESADSAHEDILRAVVVFTHASLEDLLRTILGYYYRSSPGSILQEYAKDRASTISRLEKASTDVTIGGFFEELIAEKLGATTFSTTTQICGMLDKVALEIPDRDEYLRPVADLIGRRHQIVHNADLEQVRDATAAADIGFADVSRWLERTETFGQEILGALSGWSVGIRMP